MPPSAKKAKVDESVEQSEAMDETGNDAGSDGEFEKRSGFF
jgi:hypothetical protein